MKIVGPKWVKKANQWCFTTLENTHGISSKHDVKQTIYWFSTKEEAEDSMHKMSEDQKNNEPKNN